MRIFFILPLFAILAAAQTVHVNLPVNTGISGVWRISKAIAEVPEGAVSPKLISAPQPTGTGAPASGSVSVSFQIDEKGKPFNIQVDKSSDQQLDDEVIALIREGRFEAALRGGFAVPSHPFIDLTVGQLPSDGRPRPVRRSSWPK